MEQHQALLLEQLTAILRRQLYRNRIPFLASLVFGFLAYTFAFTNKLVNHDDVKFLFDKGSTVSSGRWGLGLMDTIFPNISMPWIYGIVSIVLISVGICVIIRIFSLKSKLLQVLLAGCVMVFPSLISTFCYMFTTTSFALSFLLATIAVWLLVWDSRKGLLPALSCMIFSVSIYQSYIAIAASLLVLVLIQCLLRGDEIASVLRSGIFYVLFLTVSLGIYYAATQLSLQVLDVELNSYAERNVNFDLAEIPGDIEFAYLIFRISFQYSEHGLISTDLSRIMHYLAMGISLLLIIVWSWQQKECSLGRFLLLAALILILPLSINCMYLFTSRGAVHTLVLYSFIAVYVLIAVVADLALPLRPAVRWRQYLQHGLLNVVTICLAVIIVINIYTANAAFLNLYLRYENAYSFYTSLAANIKMMPEFTEDTKLAVLGEYVEPDFYRNLNRLDYMMGVKGFLPDSYSVNDFLEYYLAFPITCATEEETTAILESPEYAEMTCYPYYGSMRMFDNILVVKLSD